MHEFAWQIILLIVLVITVIVLIAIPYNGQFTDYNTRGAMLTDGRYNPDKNVGNYLFGITNFPKTVILPHYEKYMLSILVPSIMKDTKHDSRKNSYYSHLGKFMHHRNINCAYIHALHEGQYMEPMYFIEKILLVIPQNAIVGLIYDDKYVDVNFTTHGRDYSRIFGGLSWDKAKDEQYGQASINSVCPKSVAKIRADSGLCSYQKRPVPDLYNSDLLCDYYPPGCPNYIEQFCAYVNVINALITRDKIKCAMITRIYIMTSKIHETQMLIATKLFPYLRDVDIKVGLYDGDNSLDRYDGDNSLDRYDGDNSLDRCGGDKSLFAMLQNQCCDSVESCNKITRLASARARDSIQNLYKDNPEGMLQYIKTKNLIKNNPTFNISSLDSSCIEYCGNQNSYGTWKWTNFKKFMDGYYTIIALRVLTQEFILSDWSNVPLSWMPKE